ncbi:hypothetical protein FRC11_009943, partial [Ceratobasidium sp. 423]
GAPHNHNTSPITYLPNLAWVCIHKTAISMLQADLELSEHFPTHPLANYDAQHAKDELNAQLIQYASSLYPFDKPLAKGQTIGDWWNVDSVTSQPKRCRKAQPVIKYHQIKSPASTATVPPPTPDNALPVALDDKPGEEWLSEEALAQSHEDHLAGCNALYTHNHLEFVNLQVPVLLDILSDEPIELDVENWATCMLDPDEVIRKTSDINWDD